HDRVRLDPEGALPSRHFHTTSLSATAIWQLNDAVDLRFGVDRSERAPSQEELYAGGLHVAPAPIEIGDATMDTDCALRGEIGVRAHNWRVDLKSSLYRNGFSAIITLADTGTEQHGTPVRLSTQADALFAGAEAEAVLHLADGSSGTW